MKKMQEIKGVPFSKAKANVPFLYPHENFRKPPVFRRFPGGIEMGY